MPIDHTPGSHKLTLDGLCEEAVQRYSRRQTHRYCFLLGAGASVASGIPTGETLAKQWLQESYRRNDFSGQSLADWSKQQFGTDFDCERAGERYSDIYDLRFGRDRNDGYAHLETLMEGREPSIGYSYLGYILSETRHNVAITTNFDNLIADSVSIYGQKFPIVLADDSLAYYATTELRRPLIAKIHGGLGFAPKNSAADIGKLPDQWKFALNKIFDQYEPIVVGYAGNDGSLMDLLQALEGRTLHWCLRTSPADMDKAIADLPVRVRKLTEQHSINFVPVQGFDHLMAALWKGLAEAHPNDFPDLLDALKQKQDLRVRAHEDQRAKLFGLGLSTDLVMAKKRATSVASEPATAAKKGQEADALKALVGEEGERRKEKPWWRYREEIDAMPDTAAMDVGYKAAIEALPLSAPLLGSYANFLTGVCQRHDEAERYYERALDADPQDATTLSNFARFLTSVRQRDEEAETLLLRAVEADPKHAAILNNYANFLRKVRRTPDEAEVYYQRALEADPKHSKILGNYASFLNEIRQRPDEAEMYYQRALEADPTNSNFLGNYAQRLLETGRAVEGLSKLSAVEHSESLAPELAVELGFYRYAHDATQRVAALRRLKQLVSSGARSLEWNLMRNIIRAERDGHPNVPLLKALDAVITRDEHPATLDSFPDWRGA